LILNKFAIIVAGGTGSRMNAGIPKQFLLLAGKPLLMRSMEAFYRAVPEVKLILVLPKDQFETWQNLCRQYDFNYKHVVVSGGETRFHSVKNGLATIDSEGVVAVHDGARPMITELLIQTAFLTAEALGNCIPVVPVTETVRVYNPGLKPGVIKRDDIRIVQTPQVFLTERLKKAYQQAYNPGFTDDATVAEGIGECIHLIDGDPVNIKITHPYDLAAAEVLWSTR